MVDFLNTILSYTAALPQRAFFVFEIILAELLFTLPCKPRKHGALRLILSAVLYLAFGFFMPESFLNPPSFITLFIFVVSIGLLWFSFEISFKLLMFNGIAAYGIQSLVTRFYELSQMLLGYSAERWYYLDNLLACVLVYTVAYFTVVRQYHKYQVKIPSWPFFSISGFIFLACDIMTKLNKLMDTQIAIQLSMTLSIFMSLVLLFFVLFFGKLETDKQEMDQVLKAEQEQYRISRETIDIVNMKCHDLKHQLANIRAGMNGKDSQALEEMENAVMFYEAVSKTGNGALDAILTQKKLYCERYHISITYIADGKLLNFLSASDIWSLLCNAIDNAIENVKAEQEEERKEIFLNISKQEQFVSIHVENYCSVSPAFQNGLPVTTKADKENHGIGTKSISYIVKKYGGVVAFQCEDNLFSVNILIPLAA